MTVYADYTGTYASERVASTIYGDCGLLRRVVSENTFRSTVHGVTDWLTQIKDREGRVLGQIGWTATGSNDDFAEAVYEGKTRVVLKKHDDIVQREIQEIIKALEGK